MPNYTRIPPLNTLRLVPAIDNTPPAFHVKHFDNSLMLDQVQWEGDYITPYAQPVQTGDPISIYVDTTATTIDVLIYKRINNSPGPIYSQLAITPTLVLTGNTLYGNQLNTYLVNFTFNNSYGEDYYHFVIVAHHPDTTEESFLSEVIHLKKDWPGTVLLSATHSKNDQDVLFEQTGATFRHRLFARLDDFEPGSEDSTYENQLYELRPLKAGSYRSFTLSVGYNGGIVDWVVDKLNRYSGCNRLLLDGKRFAKELNGGVEKTAIGTGPLCTATLRVREYYHNNYTFENNTVPLFTLSQYPAAIPELVMYSQNWNFNTNVEAVWADNTALNNYCTALNANLTTYGLVGQFLVVGDSLLYQNGPGENFAPGGNSPMYDYITLTVVSTLLNQVFLFKYTAGGYNVVQWGDGTTSRNFSVNQTTQVNHSHVYPTTGTRTVRIFHNPTMKAFVSNTSQYSSMIRGIAGVAPAGLELCDLRYMNLSSFLNVNPSWLFPARFTLKTLTWSNSQIKAFSPGLFSQGGTGAWGQLVWNDMRINSFNSAQVDQYFNQKQQLTTTNPACTFLINAQNPLAPPTGASNNSRMLLQMIGCTLYHD